MSVAEEAPPDLAVRAARQAMHGSGVDPADIAVVLHVEVRFADAYTFSNGKIRTRCTYFFQPAV